MRIRVDIKLNLKDLKINRLVRFFVLSDLLFLGGWGLITPIFAIFIVDKVPGANLVTVGAAAAVYWIVKALFQMPVALYIDKHEGEQDDFHALLTGLTLAGFAAISFLLVRSVFELFVVVFIQAIAYGFYTPSWSALFSRHLDKEHYAFDWALDSTTIGVASGIAAFVGGALASWLGFDAVFIGASALSFAAAILLFSAPNLIFPRATTQKPIVREHTPADIGH